MQDSTQMNIPLKDVYRGIAVTGWDKEKTYDSKYVKVMEVRPQPFLLKKIREQNAISDAFAALLKAAPPELHIKTMSVPTDLSYQLSEIKRCVSEEENDRCKEMGQEYINRLNEAQINGVSRRFFISFPYTGRQGGLKSKSFDDIVNQLNSDAIRLAGSLAACGNEIITEYTEDPNMDFLKAMYMVYNRDHFIIDPFEDRVAEINRRYLEKMEDKYFYIPVCDYIAPERMSYMSSNYLVVNNTYYKFLYIPSNGYAPATAAGWLTRFINKPGVDVDIFLEKYSRDQVIHGIKRSIGHSRVTASESLDTSDSFEESMNTLGSAEYLKNGLSRGNDFYNMAIILTVSGPSPKVVAETTEELMLAARSDDILLKENVFRAEETFNIVLPTGVWDDRQYTFQKTRRNILTEGAAGLYPFATQQIVDKEGLYIADDFDYAPVVLDQFNRKRVNNPHIFMSGETGAGKTTTLMLIALRARVKKMPVYIIAPEKQDEYKRLTSAIGGQFVDIGAGSPDRINIMEIFPVDEKTKDKFALIDGDDNDAAESYLIRKVATLSDFFALHIPLLSSVEKFDLEEAIIATYEKKGITSSNNSLWADKARTHYKKMPVISDLVSELESKPDTVRLAKTIKLLTKGNGEHFDGQTNVDINNDFVVFGLQHNSEDMLGLSIFMTMDFITSKCMEDRTKNKFFIIDEAWKMLMNPIAANRLMASSRLLRAFSCAQIIATQNLTDVIAFENGKYGLAVLNNCATKLFLQMKAKDASIVKEMIDLSDEEESNVTKFKQAGQGLLLAGNTRKYIQMTPSDTEKLLTFTDRETLNLYEGMRKEQEYREQLEQLMEGAEDLSDLFDIEGGNDKT